MRSVVLRFLSFPSEVGKENNPWFFGLFHGQINIPLPVLVCSLHAVKYCG